MSLRELVVLGTSSAVPTRNRNHNGYLLLWDGQGFLFDPGEGTQRQMVHAGVGSHDVTWICVTHFHGDHCLGVPGIVQRIARDGVTHTVQAAYPASGETYWRRLRHATVFADTSVIVERPVSGELTRLDAGPVTLTARPLSHPVESYGYRLDEPDGRRMVPERLRERGVHGPRVGELQRAGAVTGPDGTVVRLEEVSEPRPGQSAAFIMDTRLCDGVFALAEGVDLLVIESTFLSGESTLASRYGHLTAAQAGRVAAESGARRLVLTHISERYDARDEPRFLAEAGEAFGGDDGDIVLARDLLRVPVPRRNGHLQRATT
ncbi:ribonuclease Z [Streptosporangium becharense]|uniref:Ribonuclease Z n=1 Tax=Streptosporangium becharense TaxID=1816182 RepID=A0A7W9MF83_9ACTN|nr:ribonuclease Z [Streptosporangium becharense]MBB2912210.1 ribonuclease Z [Streptosporangium becharense]MBB5818757.1 ribonuclease Z [Streptosporangium becharense]